VVGVIGDREYHPDMADPRFRPFWLPLLAALVALVAATVVMLRQGDPPFIAAMNGVTFAFAAGGLVAIVRMLAQAWIKTPE
jgi:hypothetical protein